MAPSRTPPSRRDRHGRAGRARALSPTATVGGLTVRVPAWRSRADRFRDLVHDAFVLLGARWPSELSDVAVAVDDVPDAELPASEDVVADETSGGDVPLGRVVRAGDGRPATLVVYRKPVEARADDPADLEDLVREVVVDLVAQFLGLGPDVVDPPDEER